MSRLRPPGWRNEQVQLSRPQADGEGPAGESNPIVGLWSPGPVPRLPKRTAFIQASPPSEKTRSVSGCACVRVNWGSVFQGE